MQDTKRTILLAMLEFDYSESLFDKEDDILQDLETSL